jgi:uncharacterized protein (DUF362 family)
MTPLTRRQLLRLGATAAAGWSATHWLTGCGDGTPAVTPTPTPTAERTPSFCRASSNAHRARVAVALGSDLAAMTRQVLVSLGGLESVVHSGESVFIKPNMVTLPWASSSYDPFRMGECTKPEILIALAEECLRVGASEVTIGDGSQMPHFDWSLATTLDRSTNLAREADRMSARYGRTVRLACLDVDTAEWVEVPTAISLGRVAISTLVTQADRVISVPVAKTHRWARLTLSLKNFIGITPLERYGWYNGGNHDRSGLHARDSSLHGFTQLYLDIVDAVRPDLAIIDLSIGMEGNGPSSSLGGRPVDMRDRLGAWLLLASTDLVAADATAARVMSHEMAYVEPVLTFAEQANMGAVCEPSIDLVGARLADLRVSWEPAVPAT